MVVLTRSKKRQLDLRTAQSKRRSLSTKEDVLSEAVLRTYNTIKKHWTTKDISPPVPMPPLDSCELAHRHYAYWAPPPGKIKLMLVCESHIPTNPKVTGLKIKPGVGWKGENIGHVNLLHCPSYGEPWILGLLKEVSRLDGIYIGTSAFWKVYYVVAGLAGIRPDGTDPLSADQIHATFEPLRKATSKRQELIKRKERLELKFKILRLVQERGIALWDTSPVPIYVGSESVTCVNKTTSNTYYTNNRKLTCAERNKCLRSAYEQYLAPVINEYKPGKLLLMSKQTGKACPNLQSTVEEAGGEYLGVVNHPSYNSPVSPYLMSIRQLVEDCIS